MVFWVQYIRQFPKWKVKIGSIQQACINKKVNLQLYSVHKITHRTQSCVKFHRWVYVGICFLLVTTCRPKAEIFFSPSILFVALFFCYLYTLFTVSLGDSLEKKKFQFHKIVSRAFWAIAILGFSPYGAKVDFNGLISK